MSQYNSLADIKVASVLSGLDEDRKIAAQTNRASRVKIEKGHAWLVRFIPFPMGTRGLPWARIGTHWIMGKTPCCCKQHTSPDFGGDPNSTCPICEVTDAMHTQADSDADRDDFYQCQVRLAWMMYCIVLAKEDDRGRQEEMTEEETLTPYEFNIPKAAWQTFSAKLERSKGRQGGDAQVGFLSIENGCDIWVAKDKKNAYSFDLSDNGYGPIFEMDDRYEAKMLRIWKQLKQPTVKFHDDARLNSIADMLAERAFKQAADSLSERRTGGRSRDDDDDRQSSRGSSRFSRSSRGGEESEAPARQAPPVRQAAPARQAPPVRQAAPARTTNRFATAQAALDEADGGLPPVDETDQVPGAEVPPVGDTNNDPGTDGQGEDALPEAPPAPPVRRAAAPPATQPDGEDSYSAVDQADAPAVRRTAGATPRPAAPPAAVAAARRMGPAPVSAGAAPRPAATRPAPAATAAPAQRGGSVDEDPEELPEEQRDPAPPPSQTVAAAPAPARSDALAGRLGSRLAAMKRNQG